MKLIWKSTRTRNNTISIKPNCTHLQIMQQLQEWNWLEEKLSNHFNQNDGSNTREVTEQTNLYFPKQ